MPTQVTLSLGTILSILKLLVRPAVWAWHKTRLFYWGKIKQHPYIFDKYTKRVTIYKNGHGLICNYLHIEILNPNNFHKFHRWLDIRDASKDSKFDKLCDMQARDKSERLDKFGFWYEPHDLISRINPINDESTKTLEWDFLFDAAKFKKDKIKKMRLSYSISIPGLFPITNGRFDPDKAPNDNYEFKSGLNVTHRIKEITYIISFEKGIDIKSHPVLKIFPQGIDCSPSREISLDDESDLFYNRYVGKIKKPDIGAVIRAEWKL